KSFSDGTSNTIAFATRYNFCGGGTPRGCLWAAIDLYPFFSASYGPYFGFSIDAVTSSFGPALSFIPDAGGVGVTFQVAPTLATCSTNYAQALSSAGLHVALVDGSCRTVNPGITGLTWRNPLIPD